MTASRPCLAEKALLGAGFPRVYLFRRAYIYPRGAAEGAEIRLLPVARSAAIRNLSRAPPMWFEAMSPFADIAKCRRSLTLGTEVINAYSYTDRSGGSYPRAQITVRAPACLGRFLDRIRFS